MDRPEVASIAGEPPEERVVPRSDSSRGRHLWARLFFGYYSFGEAKESNSPPLGAKPLANIQRNTPSAVGGIWSLRSNDSPSLAERAARGSGQPLGRRATCRPNSLPRPQPSPVKGEGQATGMPQALHWLESRVQSGSSAYARAATQTASNSTSNTSVAFGGITPPAPRAP